MFYNLALDAGDAETFATRVLGFELTDEQRPIYLSTLLMLLRDAYHQRNAAAVSFLRPFLTGLIPDHSIKAYEQRLSGDLLKVVVSETSPPPPPSGGLKVESAKPEPVQPSPAARTTVGPPAATFRQSGKLAW